MAQKVTTLSPKDLIERARKVRLVGMDVDGVLTAGDIIVHESGEEIKHWNARDRLIMAMIRDRRVPLTIAWITGRQSKAVSYAATDLGVRHVVQKSHDKKAAMADILKREKLDFSEAAFIGDDLIDLAVLQAVGFSAAPVDAAVDVLQRATYVSTFPGGRGVVRDVLEFILRAQDRWEPLVASLLS